MIDRDELKIARQHRHDAGSSRHGLSSHPEDGYEKTSQARDIAKILDELNVSSISLVTHDIGNMVGYALAAQFPDRVERCAVMDAPFPGLGTWEQQLLNPRVWHFNFRGPDVERLVAGRERTPRATDDQDANAKADVSAKFRYSVERLGAHVAGNQTTVTARLTGQFPGSPVDLQYHFTLEGDKIARLEIAP